MKMTIRIMRLNGSALFTAYRTAGGMTFPVSRPRRIDGTFEAPPGGLEMHLPIDRAQAGVPGTYSVRAVSTQGSDLLYMAYGPWGPALPPPADAFHGWADA